MAGRHAPQGRALLVDIGTTTTDIIPLLNGQPNRKVAPIANVWPLANWSIAAGSELPSARLGGLDLAAELFATVHDVFVILGETTESADDLDTADGRPATQEAARARLARMFCLDPVGCSVAELATRARDLADRLARQVASEIDRVTAGTTIETILVAGSGPFLLERVMRRTRQSSLQQAEIVALAERWGDAGSTAACALAVATLAWELAG